MPNELSGSLLIKKANIELKVIFHDRSVSIDPYQCKPENMRLCRGIAQVQNTMAQFYLDSNSNTPPHTLLISFFDQKGWDVEVVSAT